MGTSEDSVGIQGFLTTSRGFRGVVKQRYSDFIVQEIRLDGSIVRLGSTTISDGSETKVDGVSSAASSELDADEVNQRLKRTFGDDMNVIEQLRDFASPEGSMREDDSFLLPTEEDKAKRTAMHQALKQCFPQLESDTVEVEGLKRIRIRRRDPKRKRARRDDAGSEPGNLGWVSFSLCKENMDSIEAVTTLSKYLHVPVDAFTMAGTKDRRAVTTQEVRIRRNRITPARLAALNRVLPSRMRLGNFDASVASGLRLGDLRGNRFSIILRNVSDDIAVDEIADALLQLETRGFLNYFGLQRFGSGANSTHDVGFAVLRGDFQKAVRLILEPLEVPSDEADTIQDSRQQIRDALREYLDGSVSAKQALERVTSKRAIERSILAVFALPGKQDDHHSAFLALPKNLRLMYIHSVQSYLFNLMVSKRMQIGVHDYAIRGDLVISSDVPLSEEQQGDEPESRPSHRHAIHVVTSEDEAAKRYPIHHVVLPLLGTEVKLPDHECGSLVHEILEKKALRLESFQIEGRRFPGCYRRMVAHPDSLEWEMLTYESDDQDLTETELSVALGRPPLSKPSSDSAISKRALRVHFNLGAAAYATMFLRELTKQDSGKLTQKRLHREATDEIPKQDTPSL